MMELSDKIRPYLEGVILKYGRGNLIDDETFISICESFIDWYDVSEMYMLTMV